jgi:hypothetical protein
LFFGFGTTADLSQKFPRDFPDIIIYREDSHLLKNDVLHKTNNIRITRIKNCEMFALSTLGRTAAAWVPHPSVHTNYSQVCRWFRFAQLAKGKKFRP